MWRGLLEEYREFLPISESNLCIGDSIAWGKGNVNRKSLANLRSNR